MIFFGMMSGSKHGKLLSGVTVSKPGQMELNIQGTMREAKSMGKESFSGAMVVFSMEIFLLD